MRQPKKWIFSLFMIFLLGISCIPQAARSEAADNWRATLTAGMQGAQVALLQTELKSLGYYPAQINGHFNQTTSTAVRSFQQARGLQVDGVVGPLTWAALEGAQPVLQAPETPEQTEPVGPTEQVGQATKAAYQVLGFTAVDYPGDARSEKSVQDFGPTMTTIATFAYGIDGQGNLRGQAPQNTVTLAKAQGIQPLVLVHNYNQGFDAQAAHDLLSNPTHRQTFISNLVKIIQQNGYQGVNIDLEGIYPGDRGYYNQLLLELRDQLQPQGYRLTVSIPAKTSDDPKNQWAGGYDYATIGKYADQILLMTYDEHWFGGTPGPIASLPWVTKVVEYAAQQIAPAKILIGVATYGYDWSAKGNKALAYPQAVKLAQTKGAKIIWDDQAQVPHFSYQADGVQHQVWFENEYSARFKLRLVRQYHLAGIGIWRLGFEDAGFWSVVKAELN